MNVLGISSNYHDASAALIVDGVLVAAAAEERFSLQKHDPSFPEHSARFCLEQGGITADALDLIAYHEEPEIKFTRTLSSAFVKFPFSRDAFVKTAQEAVTSGFWLRNQISKTLNVHPSKVVCVPHHLSHASHAYLSSPFEEAAVLTIDAVGEWACTGLFHAKGTGQSASVRPIGVVPFPHSLGLVYSAFTAFLGFKVNDGECSTMALAAFGKPRFAEQVRKVIPEQRDGTYEVNLDYFDFSGWNGVPVTSEFIRCFGEPRKYGAPLPFDCLDDKGTGVDGETQRIADVAASVQLVLEERVLSLARKIRKDTGSPNLCLAGGVALNCVANGKLVQERIFENVYVPPDPGDGGGAMGAAMYAHLSAAGGLKTFRMSPYLGKSYGESRVIDMLTHMHPKQWERYRRIPPASGSSRSLSWKTFDGSTDLCARVADSLAAGKVVGWVQDRFENGPRALGNRSILIDPSNTTLARRMSSRVKERAPFRPYAAAIAEEDMKRTLVGADSPGLQPIRWMQASYVVQEGAVPALRAALHVDGTTRPQICSKSDNPRFHELLRAFGERKGLSALLNTSFNESGFPMVSSPINALTVFARTDLDMLVLNNTVVEKVD